MDITFKTTQQYLDGEEKNFNDELSNCIPKKQLKLIQADLDIPLSDIKNHHCDFSYFNDQTDLACQKQYIVNQLIANQQYQLDKELFSHILSQYVVLPQMNIDKIYTKWSYLINALYSNLLYEIERKLQKRLNELTVTNTPECVVFYNIQNEKLATISKDGIFSFKVEPNDENTKEFLKAAQTLGIEIKQINYFEV